MPPLLCLRECSCLPFLGTTAYAWAKSRPFYQRSLASFRFSCWRYVLTERLLQYLAHHKFSVSIERLRFSGFVCDGFENKRIIPAKDALEALQMQCQASTSIDPLLTTQETCEMLSISYSTLAYLIDNRGFPVRRHVGIRYSRLYDWLETFVKDNQVAPR